MEQKTVKKAKIKEESESCLFRKVVTEKENLQETAYVDHLYLKKSLLNSFILLAYGETLRTNISGEKNHSVKKNNTSMQHVWSILYIRKGRGEIFFRDKWEKITAGDVFLLPPFFSRKIRVNRGESLENCYLCIYDTKVMETMGATLALPVAGILHFTKEEEKKSVEKCFAKLKEYILYAAPESCMQRNISLLVYELLYSFAHFLSVRKEEWDFQDFLQRIYAVPAQQYTLQTLADLLHKDQRTVLRLFRKYTGSSPIQFLRSLRIQYGARLLREGDSYFKMEDIARICGYKSTSAFAQVFKKEFQKTPRQYKNAFSGRKKI